MKYLFVPDLAYVLRCGKSDPAWAMHPEVQGRHCIREAGHDGPHFAQRDDETHAQTAARVYMRDAFEGLATPAVRHG